MNARHLYMLRYRFRKLGLWIISVIILFSSQQSVFAQSPDYDHFLTGFPLDGLHRQVDCQSCHINGQFKGTPKRCESCHADQVKYAMTKKKRNKCISWTLFLNFAGAINAKLPILPSDRNII